MGVRRYQDLFAWQLAEALKEEIFRLIERNRVKLISWKYRDQIVESSAAVPKDIAEGFVRYSPAQFKTFLDYALASLAESELWLKDGVFRKYFSPEEAQEGLTLAKRCWKATLGLKHSQERELRRRRRQRRRPGPRPPDPPT